MHISGFIYNKLAFVPLALIVVSCGEGRNTNEIIDAPSETVCVFSDLQYGPIGNLNSIAVLNDARLAICTDTQAYVYDIKDDSFAKIGGNGRAQFEYVMPFYIRSDGNSIFVWDAMETKFIEYSMTGNPIGECVYPSSINDFIPQGNQVVISTGGRFKDRLVDVLDMDSSEISGSFGVASNEHKTLTWMSVAPIAVKDGRIFYSPRDKLEIWSCNPDGSEQILECRIESDSFKIEPLKAPLTSREATEYLDRNPYVVTMFENGGKWYLLASEGYYERNGRELDGRNRFFSLYKADGGKGGKVMSFTSESFGYSNLLSIYGGDLYFIHYNVDGDEISYELRRLCLR